jgi:16S rRNA processing protein RimM
VRATSFTADPLDVGAYGALSDAAGRSFKVLGVRALAGTANQIVLALSGVTDRNAAEALNGTQLMVPRSALPDTGDEDDFYHEDLIGLEARGADGGVIGQVTAVHNFGAGDMLEVRLASGKSAAVPFTRAAVPVVDVKGGVITLDAGAAGLLPDSDDDLPDGDLS